MDKEFYFTKGEEFELLIASKLKSAFKEPINLSLSLRVFSYVLNKPTEIDILLITSFGVYCIEAKSLRTLLQGSVSDKMWIGKSGKYTSRMFNPILQNTTHIRALKYAFRQMGMAPPDIKGVVCVPNGCLVDSDGANIYTIGSLFSKLEHDSVTLSKKWDIHKLKECFERIERTCLNRE